KLGLSIKESRLDGVRGTWFSPDRKDRYEISDAGVSKNLLSVAAVCKKEALVESGSGHWKLKVKPYGETFNLCPCESFFDQPAAAYALCSGVLVGEDTVVTAAHFAGEDNVGELRFFFLF
ncbi:MAG: S1 family peptidase, partial [bacterium]|nr:S1 family peptidase [bacterium]